MLSLANGSSRCRASSRLDIVHAHYAVPHATAAYLAQADPACRRTADRVPQVITTLHGTDITLVGSDRSYAETVAFSIEQSDGVTAVSESLRADTYRGAGGRASDHASSRTSWTATPTAPIDAPRASCALLPGGLREARDPPVELPARQAGRPRSSRSSRGSARAGAVTAAARRRRAGAGAGARQARALGISEAR